jgi:choice-of-anchor B domain-containing protein
VIHRLITLVRRSFFSAIFAITGGFFLTVSLAHADGIRCENGFAGDYPCKGIDLYAHIKPADLGNKRSVGTNRINDIWGWEDPETGRRYAIVGLVDGTSFVDVTIPTKPKVIGYLPTRTTFFRKASNWRDIKVYDHYAYIVADSLSTHGVQIFDLHRLRYQRGHLPQVFNETSHWDGVGSSHNIVINEDSGFAYVVGARKCGGGLVMLDLVEDPLNPKFVGCFADTRTGRVASGYTHDAQCVIYRGPDKRFQNREICVGSNETALSIADVTDKSNPKAISVASYPAAEYVHQGWFTEDQRYFVQNDELDEMGSSADRTKTFIWDLSHLDYPELIHVHMGHSESIDHNLYVMNRAIYASNYTSGLRVIDMKDPLNTKEIAFFDMHPKNDATKFAGTWSNYPFFKDFIIVSSIENGLYILSNPVK